MMRCTLLGLTIFGLTAAGANAQRRPAEATRPRGLPRALAFLIAEVPRWPEKNKCFSCHNNGDAARALYAAKRLGYDVPATALAATTAFLRKPERWHHNGGEGDFVDRKLDVIVFGHALTVASETGILNDRKALLAAASMVANDQAKDGSWQVVAAGTLGAPASYGNVIATVAARDLLARAGRKRFQRQVARANRWLLSQKPNSVMESAAVLIGLSALSDPAAAPLRKHCLDVIRRGQDESGGWGPYVSSPPEAFDTALVLLALSRMEAGKAPARSVQRGRAYLVRTQRPDGSWPETTRPPDAVSYAQRLATAGWATLALLETRQRMRDE